MINNDCRNCGHKHFYVQVQLNAKGDFTAKKILETCSLSTVVGSEYAVCGCYHFIPADNLEYLEYELKQQNK